MRPSRSAIATRRACPTKRFWGFDAFGTGLERKSASLSLAGGTSLHANLARIGMGANVDQVIAEEQAAFRAAIETGGVNGTLPEHLEFLIREQQTLIEGLIRGWVKFRLPLILDEYEPVAIEQEWLVDMGELPGDFKRPLYDHRGELMTTDNHLWLPLRIDWLERHRGTGLLHIRDFKGLSYIRDGWREHYLHDLQTILYPEAVERHTGEYVGGMEYEALLKGGRRKGGERSQWSDRELQQSPLCYGYVIETDKERTYQSDYTTRKGSRKFAVWEEFANVEDWFTLHLAESTWRELYTTTGMICPTKEERAIALEQVKRGEWAYMEAVRQIEIAMAVEGVGVDAAVNAYLEPNDQHCYAYGTRHRCAFYELCHGGLTEGPLECGLYTLRVDHHTIEPEPEQEAA